MRRIRIYEIKLKRIYLCAIITLTCFFLLFYYKTITEIRINYNNRYALTPEYDQTNEQAGWLIKRGLLLDTLDRLNIQATIKTVIFGDALPHLFGVKNVNPKVLLTAPTNFRRTPPEIVIAIPTVKRIEKEYFKDMIQNLMKNIEHYEWRNVLFLVFVANFPSDEKSSIDIINWLNLTFPKAVNQGLFEVIEPPELYYPSDLDLIEPTFNDSRERMVWRTKQNLDYAYLMTYARLSRFSSRFYLQIEDDVLSAPGYVNEILKYANSNPKFLTIDYASLGFIGKLFHIYDLHLFINSILMFYRDKPVDWILDQYFYSRFCSPEKNGCVNRINGVHRFHRKPSLFQHVGKHSSLPGKLQKLKEKTFQKTSKREDPKINDFDVDLLSTTHPKSDVLNNFFKHGHSLRFDNPNSDIFILVKFKSPIEFKEIDIEFAYESIKSSHKLELVVEVNPLLNTTAGFRQLLSSSKYRFYYTNDALVPISQLRVTVLKAKQFKYFTFTLLEIR